MMKMSSQVQSLLKDSIDLIGIVKMTDRYLKVPYKSKPLQYESLPNDYTLMKNKMYEIFNSYYHLTDEERSDSKIQVVFYSCTSMYKRTIRAMMSRLCEVLDTDCGLSICRDVYNSLLNILEQVSSKPHTDLESNRDLVDLLGLRMLHLEDVVKSFEIPLSFYDFFIGESVEFDDLYEGIFMSAYK